MTVCTSVCSRSALESGSRSDKSSHLNVLRAALHDAEATRKVCTETGAPPLLADRAVCVRRGRSCLGACAADSALFHAHRAAMNAYDTTWPLNTQLLQADTSPEAV